MNNPELFNEDHEATFCPEDDKLRLYVGRVPRDQYEALRAEGWTSTPKQDCDFVAIWTPEREDTALSYAGVIGDEDQSPQDRAADRAERFAGYRDKRLSEAGGHADRYEAGPQAHGYQSHARAERAATRHDRIAGRAVNSWDKADYWTARTAGVIDNALYRSRPDVRMGRIKTLESELRKAEAAGEEYRKQYEAVQAAVRDPLAAIARVQRHYREEDPERAAERAADHYLGHGQHRHPQDPSRREYLFVFFRECADGNAKATLFGLMLHKWKERHHAPESPESGANRYRAHLGLRLAYENQMLEAQGGREAFTEMEAGGTMGGFLVVRVYKSGATGRVTSVDLLRKDKPSEREWGAKKVPGTDFYLCKIDTERLPAGSYTAPTEESKARLAEFEASKKAQRKELPKAPPLVNPTDEDAERLLAVWDDGGKENASRARYGLNPLKIHRMTQARYSEISKGTYARGETKGLTGGGYVARDGGYSRRPEFPIVAKVRTLSDGPVILTDKPQKPLGPDVWQDPRPATVAEVIANLPLLISGCCKSWRSEMTPEETVIFDKACMVGLAQYSSESQFGVTDLCRDLPDYKDAISTARA